MLSLGDSDATAVTGQASISSAPTRPSVQQPPAQPLRVPHTPHLRAPAARHPQDASRQLGWAVPGSSAATQGLSQGSRPVDGRHDSQFVPALSVPSPQPSTASTAGRTLPQDPARQSEWSQPAGECPRSAPVYQRASQRSAPHRSPPTSPAGAL